MSVNVVIVNYILFRISLNKQIELSNFPANVCVHAPFGILPSFYYGVSNFHVRAPYTAGFIPTYISKLCYIKLIIPVGHLRTLFL